jgi:hypothetical protein
VAIVIIVTHLAIATAPLGVWSGEGAMAVAVLAVAQVVLVAFLAPFVGRFFRFVPQHDRGAPAGLQWSGPLGLVGMVVTCVAFAAWSLHDGNALIVNTALIAGRSEITNVGAWWPGLFAAMAALTVVAITCAPGISWRAKGGAEPVPPSMSDEHTAPTAVGT